MNINNLLEDEAIYRMESLLLDDKFSLSSSYLCKLHGEVFRDIYLDSGIFRSYNIAKDESQLNDNTVLYADYHNIRDLLNAIFDRERSIDYKKLDPDSKIRCVTDFCAKIWGIHPFSEGNTRVTALYIEKYLRYLGFKVNNSLFQENANYFRNALVRANYYNYKYGVLKDNRYLYMFFRKLLVDQNIVLDDGKVCVWELFDDKIIYSKKRKLMI